MLWINRSQPNFWVLLIDLYVSVSPSCCRGVVGSLVSYGRAPRQRVLKLD
jgi:hypothetical protein